MADRPTSPRITPLPEAEWDERTRELLGRAGVTGGDTSGISVARNIFTTLVRHPRLFRHWLPFGGALLTGSLPARDREILILRTAWRCRSEYEWGQHVRIALDAGLAADEIDRIAGEPDAGWSPLEVALIYAADELHADDCVGDETWRVLAARYDEAQLVEIVMLVGQYHLVAGALNSFGVQREPGVTGFPE